LIYEYVDGRYEYMGPQIEVSEQEPELVVLANTGDSEANAKDLDELRDGSEVARTTTQRVVKKLLGEKRLTQIGKGKKGNAFRYFSSEEDSAQTTRIDGHKEINSEPVSAGGVAD
jgi:hypothetical protein